MEEECCSQVIQFFNFFTAMLCYRGCKTYYTSEAKRRVGKICAHNATRHVRATRFVPELPITIELVQTLFSPRPSAYKTPDRQGLRN